MMPRALVLFPFVLIATLGAGPALADSPVVLYRLGGEYAFQEGCFGQCLCPVLLGALHGTFGLTPAPPSGGLQIWTVSDVDWLVPQLGARLTGSGLYRLRPGPDPRQQLILDLSFDGGPVETYDSGMVAVDVPFPRIDVLVSLFDLQCWDRVLQVQAAPVTRPIAFRFEGMVTTVFDGLGALDGSVVPGAPLRGVYVFDPTTPNTAEPRDEGEPGLYHHDRPPAGVRIRAGRFTFRSVPADPDFDIIVNNEIGFAGADEYGFVSRNNEARGLRTSAPIGRLDLGWLASTFTADPLRSADLPLTPPDLSLLGGGVLTIEGECTLCLGPAAFFRIEATLTSLTTPMRMAVEPDMLWWEGPENASGYDLLRGDLAALRAGGGFAAATEECLADDHASAVLAFEGTPATGQVLWLLARPVTAVSAGSYDSFGVAQIGERDEGIGSSGGSCP